MGTDSSSSTVERHLVTKFEKIEDNLGLMQEFFVERLLQNGRAKDALDRERSFIEGLLSRWHAVSSVSLSKHNDLAEMQGHSDNAEHLSTNPSSTLEPESLVLHDSSSQTDVHPRLNIFSDGEPTDNEICEKNGLNSRSSESDTTSNTRLTKTVSDEFIEVAAEVSVISSPENEPPDQQIVSPNENEGPSDVSKDTRTPSTNDDAGINVTKTTFQSRNCSQRFFLRENTSSKSMQSQPAIVYIPTLDAAAATSDTTHEDPTNNSKEYRMRTGIYYQIRTSRAGSREEERHTPQASSSTDSSPSINASSNSHSRATFSDLTASFFSGSSTEEERRTSLSPTISLVGDFLEKSNANKDSTPNTNRQAKKRRQRSESEEVKADVKRNKSRPKAGYLCAQCDKIFATLQGRKYHAEACHLSREFGCNQCDKTFRQSTSLIRHIHNFHEGRRPYTCDICTRGFPSPSELKAHKERHTATGFGCPVCGKTLYDKKWFEKHVKSCTFKSKHPETAKKLKFHFKCSNCQRLYRDKQSYRNHTKNCKPPS